jgi:hypothetical protein
MKKRLPVGVIVLLSLAAVMLPGVAGGAPTPVYALSCAAGGDTKADWSRAKLVQVTFEWTAPAGSSVTFAPMTVPALSPTPPRGFIVTATPSSSGVSPASVTALFEHVDGSIDPLTVACS